MKFFAGFVVGTISGVAIHLFQSKDAIPNVNDTKIYHNIKDFKDTLADLQKNAAVVPEVVAGIKQDLTDYTQSIEPEVAELKESIQEMQENVNKFNKF